jgi:uncharacterized membrane protein HdeD (DUF308 family)
MLDPVVGAGRPREGIDMQRDERMAAELAAGTWWVFLVTGIIWLVASLIVLRFEESSITTVGVILGIVFAVAAANEFVIAALVDSLKWVHVLLGALFVLGALWAFFQPKEAFWALASVLGLLLLLKGSFDLIGSVMAKDVNPLWWLGLVVGVLEILLAFWVSQQYYPARGALILIWVGFLAMFRGITEIVLAFELRRAGKELAAA